MKHLHITNGDVVADAIAAAGIAGTTITYADVLHEGEVPAADDAANFIRVRAREIARLGFGESRVRAQLEQFQRTLGSCGEFDDVTLWYEHDLFDQLLLIRLLAWWADHPQVSAPSLVSPAEYLGAASRAALVDLFAARSPVGVEQLQEGAVAWRAFTATDPATLASLVDRGESAHLPHLTGALCRLLEEYPSSQNGLGRTEQQILEILRQSPMRDGELFAANCRREERVFMGDTTFAGRVERMLNAERPLIERREPNGVLSVTAVGMSALEYEVDDVATNGIDRWIGGVHLRHGHVWRWTGETLRRD